MLTIENGALVLSTPYQADLVTAIKTLPATHRKWDSARKVWCIDPVHAPQVASWVTQFTGKICNIPVATGTIKTEQRILEVHYIGACKERGAGETTAFGWMNNSWAVIFPEPVLRAWFGLAAMPTEAHTLYSVVGVTAQATPDEIKSGYRRLARQWHPDVCKEPNASEQFLAIKHAYDVLSDARLRAKYDAGLKLEASLKATPPRREFIGHEYRSPLRCGLIIADGQERLGRFVVERIGAWEDIQNQAGLILIASWPAGAKEPVEQWVKP